MMAIRNASGRAWCEARPLMSPSSTGPGYEPLPLVPLVPLDPLVVPPLVLLPVFPLVPFIEPLSCPFWPLLGWQPVRVMVPRAKDNAAKSARCLRMTCSFCWFAPVARRAQLSGPKQPTALTKTRNGKSGKSCFLFAQRSLRNSFAATWRGTLLSGSRRNKIPPAIRRSRGQRLRRQIQSQHPAIHLFHVNQRTGDVVLAGADLLDAADGHPANPLALGTRLVGADVDERADPRERRQLEPDADLVVGTDAAFVGADANASRGQVDNRAERPAGAARAIPALDRDGLLFQIVSAVFPAFGRGCGGKRRFL